MVALPERQVTMAVARFLGASGFQVDAMALPGGGAGTILHPNRPEQRGGLTAVVPDIVARLPMRRWLFVEAKPLLSISDSIKLLAVSSGAYDESIRRVFGVATDHIATALAFSGDVDAQSDLVLLAEEEVDVGFHLSSEGRVSVVWDRLGAFRRGVGSHYA